MSLLLLALFACKSDDAETDPPVDVDLTARLGPGEVRAGVVTDEAALFGGVSAEGRAGDIKIYNDRVQFVIQGARSGSYYLQTGGGVIDADIVRPEGEVGRDIVDEWCVMLGFGRLLEPTSVEVVSDGTDGAAVVRVTGQDVPLALLLGVLENPAFFPAQGLDAVTEYRLEPDSWLLEVTTTVTASTPVSNFAMGDLIMGAPELADSWRPGTGLQPADGPRQLTGYIAHHNDGAVALIGKGQPLEAGGAADLIAALADLVLGFEPSADLAAGETRSWTRYYAAGPDLATLTDAALGGEALTGVVTAPDGPVAGARVHVLRNGAPYTIAVTDAEGAYSALVPSLAEASVAVDGRGRGMFFDLPEGSAAWPAFASDPVFERAAATLTAGSPRPPLAQGRGVDVDGTDLGQPGTVTVSVADGLPFTVRIGSHAPDSEDRRLVRGRPDQLAAAGWSRGGPITLQVEPGTWDILVHRGMRYEIDTGTVDVVAGGGQHYAATLTKAYEHPGYLLGDPHSHASPSGDGEVSMDERILVTAAGGVQLHFGSDHDRVADYRPLVAALGLDPVLTSVVADEVSSVLRGHMNTYPLEPDRSLDNNGAVAWWIDIPADTEDLVRKIRERHGDVVVQSNHPLDSGVAESADWSPGYIGSPDFWSTELDAIEVLNDGQHDDYFQVYVDLVNRGYMLTPVGVSDSHGHFQSTPGINGTFIGLGTDDPTAYRNEDLLHAYAADRTIASLGVFLDLSIAPGSVISTPQTLQVTARTPSWITVDRVKLLVDGVEAEVVPGNTATFTLDAPQDASFIVVAEGDTPMQPVTGRRPWAASAAIRLDVDGNGWTPPLPPLELD
ncbi:MAG: CehA/McbA family metallohydrolase [Alphaproteobacteria bacterium]|nr:CehA/McbA family metallohydrolase [Alphaproteobacteria bacterium]